MIIKIIIIQKECKPFSCDLQSIFESLPLVHFASGAGAGGKRLPNQGKQPGSHQVALAVVVTKMARGFTVMWRNAREIGNAGWGKL
ncbi:hypothetical protein [Brevibacillus gelatini]|uniref:hypothetical protein n=1 Tax=Brevibacillus gelatini TaxID=1655277 RepID=UPI0011CE0D9A|nr:hypothetical protein [Brevibacillus gelatini]